MQTSKIKSTQASGTYVSKFDGATMYTSEVELEDGTVGEVSAKSPDRWNVGDEVSYTVTEGKFGKKLKLNRPDYGNNVTSTSNTVTRFHDRDEKRQHLIMNQWAIKTAIDCELSLVSPDKFELRNAIAIAKMLKKYALDLDNVDVTLQADELIEKPF
jgi:hypothetical protein